MNKGQSHENQHEGVEINRGYHHATFQRYYLSIIQELANIFVVVVLLGQEKGQCSAVDIYDKVAKNSKYMITLLYITLTHSFNLNGKEPVSYTHLTLPTMPDV